VRCLQSKRKLAVCVKRKKYSRERKVRVFATKHARNCWQILVSDDRAQCRENLVSEDLQACAMKTDSRKQLEKALAAYSANPNLPELSAVFIKFVDDKIANGWADEDNVLLGELIRQFGSRIFCSIPVEERIPYYIHPYADMHARATLLLSTRRTAISMPVALFLFENDEHETVQELALEILASGGWPSAEKEAIKFWNTRTTIRQIMALQCLQNCRSPLLEKYIQKGLRSRNTNVRLFAGGTATLERLELERPDSKP
jgi:hypothetical protein